jgi:hypothetical protein
MAGDEELLSVDDQEMFAAALGDEPPAEKPEQQPSEEPKPEGERPRDEQGRFIPKAPEAETPASLEPLKEQEAQRQSPEDAIPSWRLREETNRRRQAEEQAQLAAREATELRHYLQQLQRQQQQPKPLPDMIEDPAGYGQAIQEQARLPVEQLRQEFAQWRLQQEQRAIAASFERAGEAHGEEFKKAYEAFNHPSLRDDDRLLEQIRNSYDPGSAILKWYRQNDPAAQRDKLKAELLNDPEFRKEFAGALRSQATSQKPSNVTSLPNLTRAPGSAGNATDDWPTTDAGIFSSVTAGLRNR